MLTSTEEFKKLKTEAEKMNLDITECLKDHSIECLKRVIALGKEEELKESLLNIENLNKKSSNRKLRNK